MLTVFMATHNGEQVLPSVLESFAHLQSPVGGWKLIVIDNASTDHTKEVVATFLNKLPLSYLFEEKLGKNAALNVGLNHLEGDLAIFTDDDVYPHADWLVHMREAADTNISYSMFGGAIQPRWQIDPPEWLKWVPIGPTFALTDSDWQEGPTEPVNLFGPNMAIRAQVFENVRFDTSIGPRGTNYAMGSETELVMRLGAQGLKAWHVKGAVVEHFIRDRQMTQEWVLNRAVRYGRGSFRRAKSADSNVYPNWLGLPLRLLIKLLKPSLRIAKARISANQRELFLSRWQYHYLLGYVIEARQYART